MSTRDDYYDVFSVYLPVAVVVFAVVCGLIGFAVLRGRRRRAGPSSRRNHLALEAGYAAALVLVTAALLTLTLRVDGREDAVRAGEPSERIDVIAAQWHWRFEYPRHDVAIQGTDAHQPTLVVPRGVPVAFAGRSLDVIHAFWIPTQRFQRQLFNDRVTRFTMTFGDGDDAHTAPCSFFCGLGHPSMRFGVRVLEPEEFDAWIRERREARR